VLRAHDEPTIDVEHLTRDPPPRLGTEEQERTAQLFPVADGVQRGLHLDDVAVVASFRRQCLPRLARDNPRRDAVDRDPEWSELPRKRGGEADDCELRDPVDAFGGKRSCGGLVDDSPAAARSHRGNDGLGALPGSRHVDGEGTVSLVAGELHRRVHDDLRHERGVVHEDIHSAEFDVRTLDEALH